MNHHQLHRLLSLIDHGLIPGGDANVTTPKFPLGPLYAMFANEFVLIPGGEVNSLLPHPIWPN